MSDFRLPLEQTTFPTGGKIPFGGFKPPVGWLMLNGATLSRVSFSALFAALTLATTGNTTTGSATISNIPSSDVAVVDVGMPITGPGIPTGATIATIASSTSITISVNATVTATAIAIVIYGCGVGDSSTTFVLPDSRQRFPLGKAATQSVTGSRLGSIGGTIDDTHGSPITTGPPSATQAGATPLLSTKVTDTHTHQVSLTASNPAFWVTNWIIKT